MPRALHRWNLTPRQAIGVQHELRAKVITADRLGTIRTIAGVDVGYEQGGRLARAAIVVLSFPGLELVESAVAYLPVTFPYVPGLLSFREVPVVLAALKKLKRKPSVLLCDGQGLAHPRRFGLACHLGVLSDLPAIGVAKTRLIGEFVTPGARRGARRALTDKGEVIGTVLRTRSDVKPLFVSVGHRVSLATAIKLVLAATRGYRLPETTRAAHRLASGGR